MRGEFYLSVRKVLRVMVTQASIHQLIAFLPDATSVQVQFHSATENTAQLKLQNTFHPGVVCLNPNTDLSNTYCLKMSYVIFL